ncbi:LysR substrate-binding domain-containing protein [Sorangium sp. So ce861]|uniref:LysR family transcriptional regulator n=1 Tax=Sorangium sp. So ce861 TaxID=3133323 RepID=UPI003F6159D1
MDSLANIEAFVRAAELGSITRAARSLHITASAASRRIAQLEDELRVRLFHRTTRALRLSEEGRAFLERCQRILEELQAAKQSIAHARGVPEGPLCVEAPAVFGRLLLVPALPRFLAEHPRVELELRLRDAVIDPAAEGVDVSLRIGRLEDAGIVARRLGVTRMLVCASPEYLRRRGAPETPEDLRQHRCLGFLRDDRVVPWRLRSPRGTLRFEPTGAPRVNDGDALKALAVAGAGLAWVFDFMIAPELASGALVTVLDELAVDERPIHALYQSPRHVIPRVRVFLDFAATLLGPPPR